MVSKQFFGHILTRVPVSKFLLEAVKTFSEPPWPHGVLLGTPREVTVPLQRHGPALPYEGFEKCGWYRKMTLMIYLLSLVVAGDVLYNFPFLQDTSGLSNEAIGFMRIYSPMVRVQIWNSLAFCFHCSPVAGLQPTHVF